MDNTALSAYRRCPTEYKYAYHLHRRGRGLPTPALNYGSGWHTIMQLSYGAPEMTRDQLIEYVEAGAATKWGVSSDPGDYRTFARSIVEYQNYLKRYGLPWEEPEQTVGWPDHPMVEIATELPIPGARHPYAGKLDRIITEHGQHLIEDHKTTSSDRSDYMAQWEIDNQMIGYDVLAMLVTGVQLAGVRINLHVVRKSDSVFNRRTIYFSPGRVKDWMFKYDEWLDRMERDIIRHNQGDPLAFPENWNSCHGRKYGSCAYTGVCSLDPDRRQYALEQDFDLAVWNPLEAEEDA